jgi:hypothetical protein
MPAKKPAPRKATTGRRPATKKQSVAGDTRESRGRSPDYNWSNTKGRARSASTSRSFREEGGFDQGYPQNRASMNAQLKMLNNASAVKTATKRGGTRRGASVGPMTSKPYKPAASKPRRGR